MVVRRLLFAAFTWTVLLVSGRATAQVDAGVITGLVERVGPSIVRLAIYERGQEQGNGTGFVVRSDGVVATNNHVVSDVDGELVAVFRDGTRRKVIGVLSVDADRDIALVRIEGSGYQELPFAPSESVQVGVSIFLVGSSAGLDQSLGVGVISALRPEGFSEEWKGAYRRAGKKITAGPIVQHTASSAPGASGSPIVDMEGRVVAVHHSQLVHAPLYFGAHVDALRELISRTNFEAPPRPLGQNVSRNLMISAGVIGGFGLVGLVVWMIRRLMGRRDARRQKAPVWQ